MSDKLSDTVRISYPTSPALADSIKGLELEIDSLKAKAGKWDTLARSYERDNLKPDEVIEQVKRVDEAGATALGTRKEFLKEFGLRQHFESHARIMQGRAEAAEAEADQLRAWKDGMLRKLERDRGFPWVDLYHDFEEREARLARVLQMIKKFPQEHQCIDSNNSAYWSYDSEELLRWKVELEEAVG